MAALQTLLDGPHADIKDRVRRLLSDPAFAYPDPSVSNAEYRETVLRWTQLLADQGIGALAYPEWAGGDGDIAKFIAAFETIATHDLSLVVKYGVQFGLWGGSVNALGSDEQRRELLPQIGTLELPGAFAMTERGHGSNVRELETTATLDRATDEWVIQTPDATTTTRSGSATRPSTASMATVFAQLVIDGEDYGVHAFVVPIRDADGDAMPERPHRRTAGTRWGSTGSTTGGSGSTTSASRGRTCSAATPRCRETGRTRARSRAPASGSSSCSARSSAGGSRSGARPTARPRPG